MKKLFILALALSAVALTGVLVADSADVEAPATLELSDVLPATVLDQVTAGASGFDLCPRRGIYCLDVYDPVTCDQGTFSNACYAYVACATNCTPGEATF